MRYPWHPQFGSEIQIAYREHRRGEEVVVFASPDRSRTVLPAWMLDANACAAMTIASPRVEISALLELRVLLTAMGFDRNASPVGEQERPMKALPKWPIPTRSTGCSHAAAGERCAPRNTGGASSMTSTQFAHLRDVALDPTLAMRAFLMDEETFNAALRVEGIASASYVLDKRAPLPTAVALRFGALVFYVSLARSTYGDIFTADVADDLFREDLHNLGLRHRRGHDLRRTFITLAQVDGARRDLLKVITHGPAANDIVSLYTSFPWASLCAEVAKLRIDLRPPAPPSDKAPKPRPVLRLVEEADEKSAQAAAATAVAATAATFATVAATANPEIPNDIEPVPGYDPGTYGLRNRCSTTELHRRSAGYLVPELELSCKGHEPAPDGFTKPLVYFRVVA